MSPRRPTLLSIFELGGYPNFTPLYQRAGFEVETAVSMRKALARLKADPPEVIVAEFNFQSDFRDRTSSLESLMAMVQRLPHTRVIVFYDPEYRHQLERLSARFPLFAALHYPIDPQQLKESLRRALEARDGLTAC